MCAWVCACACVCACVRICLGTSICKVESTIVLRGISVLYFLTVDMYFFDRIAPEYRTSVSVLLQWLQNAWFGCLLLSL